MTFKQSIPRWILYLGGKRPTLENQDSAFSLLNKARKIGLPPTKVFLAEGDSLLPFLDHFCINYHFLPACLTDKRKVIMQALIDPLQSQDIEVIVREIMNTQATWGLSFYSPWMPPCIFNAPLKGFLNFHPGTLPELKGYEPDTWAILHGFEKIHGSVHYVTEGFDEGSLALETTPIKIYDWDTPISLLKKVTNQFLFEFPNFISDLLSEKIKFRPQKKISCLLDLSNQRLHNESIICWQDDTHEKIYRRLRAFNGQCIFIHLKAPICNELFEVINLELWEGEFPGNPGDVLGIYQDYGNTFYHSPILRTKQGIALVKLGKFNEILVLPPQSIVKKANLEIIRTSITWPKCSNHLHYSLLR